MQEWGQRFASARVGAMMTSAQTCVGNNGTLVWTGWPRCRRWLAGILGTSNESRCRAWQRSPVVVCCVVSSDFISTRLFLPVFASDTNLTTQHTICTTKGQAGRLQCYMPSLSFLVLPTSLTRSFNPPRHQHSCTAPLGRTVQPPPALSLPLLTPGPRFTLQQPDATRHL